MTCINPTLGSPRWALMSVVWTAVGLPDESVPICASMAVIQDGDCPVAPDRRVTAIQSGANVKVVQRMLGHESAAVTLDTYSDLFPDDLVELADKLDAAGRSALAAVDAAARAAVRRSQVCWVRWVSAKRPYP